MSIRFTVEVIRRKICHTDVFLETFFISTLLFLKTIMLLNIVLFSNFRRLVLWWPTRFHCCLQQPGHRDNDVSVLLWAVGWGRSGQYHSWLRHRSLCEDVPDVQQQSAVSYWYMNSWFNNDAVLFQHCSLSCLILVTRLHYHSVFVAISHTVQFKLSGCLERSWLCINSNLQWTLL